MISKSFAEDEKQRQKCEIISLLLENLVYTCSGKLLIPYTMYIHNCTDQIYQRKVHNGWIKIITKPLHELALITETYFMNFEALNVPWHFYKICFYYIISFQNLKCRYTCTR